MYEFCAKMYLRLSLSALSCCPQKNGKSQDVGVIASSICCQTVRNVKKNFVSMC